MIGIRRKKNEESEKDIRTQNQAVLVGFRAAYVFDVSQTEGAELPEFSERVSGSAGEYRSIVLFQHFSSVLGCRLFGDLVRQRPFIMEGGDKTLDLFFEIAWELMPPQDGAYVNGKLPAVHLRVSSKF